MRPKKPWGVSCGIFGVSSVPMALKITKSHRYERYAQDTARYDLGYLQPHESLELGLVVISLYGYI